ncbi:MAG: hypothetical protein ABSG51_01365 [Terracidiphilus sp.]|jgi:hypothetical protein
MPHGRRTILSLVALGRISPAEAERLLIAWNQGREGFWVCAACIAIALLALLDPNQALPGLVHLAHSLLSGRIIPLHHPLQHALAVVGRLFGGSL